MDTYEGNPARTVPIDQRTSSPREGEIIVRTVKHARLHQLSIHLKYLVPWKPLVRSEVVILNGSMFGSVGVAKGREGNDWIVTFTVDDDSWDFIYEEKDITPLEPLK